MTIIGLQRRLTEVGRIRLGHTVETRNGRQRPAKLDTFRITSPDRKRMEQVAELYGGTPGEWQAPAGRQWEVITDTDVLDIIVPPSDMAFTPPTYELWSKAGCQRRCDGVTEQLTEGPCLCDPEDRECDIKTRLSVMLQDLQGLGLFRVDSTGYYAAVELSGAVQVIAAAAGRGALLPARLRLDQRSVKRTGDGGKPATFRFSVPVIDIDVTPAQLLAAASNGAGQLADPGSVPQLAAGDDDGAPLTPVPESVQERPAPPVADQAKAVEQPDEGPKRANAQQPVPETGLAPRKASEVDDDGWQPPELQAEADNEDLDDLTVKELKELLRAADLKVSGRKSELIDRLRDHQDRDSSVPSDVGADGAEGQESPDGAVSPSASSGDQPPPPGDPSGGATPPDWKTMAPTRQQTTAIHTIYSEHGIDEATYRAVLRTHYGVESHNDLTRGQLSVLIDSFDKPGGVERFKRAAQVGSDG